MHPSFCCLFLPALLGAQKVVDAAHEQAATGWWSLSGDWFCIQRSVNAPVVLTGLQFRFLRHSSTATPVDFGVFDEDPVTGNPRNLLGSGTGSITEAVPGWYGARFATPIPITLPGRYFVGVKLPATGVDLGLATQGTRTPHWVLANGSWNGPFVTHAWPFRLYEGMHAGQAATFGTGQAGWGNVVPEISAEGWPHTTNTIEVHVRRARAGHPGGIALGTRIALTAPFGTLWALPLIWVPVTYGAVTPAGIGYASLSLAIPADPSLHGGVVAAQGWVFDPAAYAGFAHSGGLELTLAH